jgi:hypothetical protein
VVVESLLQMGAPAEGNRNQSKAANKQTGGQVQRNTKQNNVFGVRVRRRLLKRLLCVLLPRLMRRVRSGGTVLVSAGTGKQHNIEAFEPNHNINNNIK